MLEKYAEYLPKVGPLKLFLKKKDLWQQISVDLLNELNVTKNAIQVENRYKTIIKRKKMPLIITTFQETLALMYHLKKK